MQKRYALTCRNCLAKNQGRETNSFSISNPFHDVYEKQKNSKNGMNWKECGFHDKDSKMVGSKKICIEIYLKRLCKNQYKIVLVKRKRLYF